MQKITPAVRASHKLRGGRSVKTARGIVSFAPVVVAGVIMLWAESANAADECGVAVSGPSATVVCDVSSYIASPDGGITYRPADGDSLNLTIDLRDVSIVRNDVSPFSAVSVITPSTAAEDLVINVIGFGEIRTLDPDSTSFNNAGYGIHARQLGAGDATIRLGSDPVRIDALGHILTVGPESHGALSEISNNLASPTVPDERSAFIEMNGGTISTQGYNARGLYALTRSSAGQARVEMNGGIITTTGTLPSARPGTGSEGIFARAFGSSPLAEAAIVLNGGLIETQAQRAHGVFAESREGRGSSRITVSGGSIKTYGASASAVYTLSNAGANFSMTGGTLETFGDNASGAFVYTGGAAEAQSVVTGGSILSSGAGSYGVVVWSVGGSTEALFDATLTGGSGSGGGVFSRASATGTSTIDIGQDGVIGAYSDLALFADGGAVTVNNDGTILGMIRLSNQSDLFINNTPNSWNIRNFADTNGDFVRDREAVAVSEFGAGADTFTNATNGVVRLLTVEDMSALTPSTDDDVTPTSWDTLTVSPYSPATGNPDHPTSGLSITDAGIEQAQLLNLEVFEHFGLLTMADAETGGMGPSAGDVFVITGGNTAGTPNGGQFISNGGALHIDTVLNDGVTDVTDVLVIDRAVLGTAATGITITNAGGVAASTDLNGNGLFDADEGILVVQALEEGSDAGAFALSGPVVSGAWQYVLNQTDGQSWYLHSDYSDAARTYEIYPHTLLDLTQLPSLFDRVGNRHWAGEEGAFEETAFVFCKDPAQNFSCAVTPEQAQVYAGAPITQPKIEGQGVWMRVDGSRIQFDPQSGTTGTTYDAVIAGVQVGYDHLLHDGATGDRLIGGVSLRYQTSDADVTESDAESVISSTGIGLGGSLTWYAKDGLYVDAQAEVTALTTDMSTATLGTFVDGHELTGYAVSLEAGKAFTVGETLTITPQAQLTYATVSEDGYVDNQGTDISFDAESLRFRLGVEVSQETSWEAEDGTTSGRDLRAGAHVVKEFHPETSVDVSGTTLRSEADDTTGEITLGGTYNWSDDKYSVYGQVGASTGLNSFGDSSRVRGTFGFRTRWE